MARASFDFTNKDFDSLRARSFELIRSVFPEWTDARVANFGNLLVEQQDHVGDVILFYLDALARERFIATATLRRSMIALGRLVGYRMPGASAATVDMTLTLAAVPTGNVVFTAGTFVRTEEVGDPIRFQLLAGATILSGANPPTVQVVAQHSRTITQSFPATGLPNLDLLLDRTPFLDGTADISANNGDYTEVDSLLNSGPTDRHFVVLVDQRDRATVRFGDGRTGAPPTGTVDVTYKIGGGKVGNVDAGTLVVLEGSFQDVNGRTVRVSATNAEAAAGGADRQTVEAARLRIPEHTRLTSRCVTRDDFEVAARLVPGVARALMATSNEDAAVDENAGILFVVPEGGGTPTQPLLDDVETMVTVTRPHTLTFRVEVRAPIYETVNVWARVTIADGQVPATVRNAIRANLQAFFAVQNEDGTPNAAVDFGLNLHNEVAWSDLFNVVRDTAGVRKINPHEFKLNDQVGSVGLLNREFPRLGTVVVVNAATGAVI